MAAQSVVGQLLQWLADLCASLTSYHAQPYWAFGVVAIPSGGSFISNPPVRVSLLGHGHEVGTSRVALRHPMTPSSWLNESLPCLTFSTLANIFRALETSQDYPERIPRHVVRFPDWPALSTSDSLALWMKEVRETQQLRCRS